MHPLHERRPAVAIDPVQVEALLDTDAVARRVMARKTMPASGALVGVRLNLNVFKSTGEAIQTVHAGRPERDHTKNKGFFKGPVLGYARAVTLSNAYFNVDQTGREAIARGDKPKFQIASVDGHLLRVEDVQAPCDGVEVRFNPKAGHLFCDANGRAVHSAEEVTVIGHRCYARGRIVYHTSSSAPARAGDAPSATVLSDTPDPYAAPLPSAPASVSVAHMRAVRPVAPASETQPPRPR